MKKWILPILMAGFLLTGCSSPAATSSVLSPSTEKNTGTQMTENPGEVKETETETATETQQEPMGSRYLYNRRRSRCGKCSVAEGHQYIDR